MRNDEGERTAGEGWEDCGFTLHGDGGGLHLGILGDGGDSLFREIAGVQDAEKTGSAKQSHVPNGHWKSLEKAVAGTTEDGICRRDVVPVGGVTLDALAPLALSVLKEVMETNVHEEDPNFARLLSAKKDAAVSTVNALLKADENQFKKRNTAVIDELLSRIREQKAARIIEGRVLPV